MDRVDKVNGVNQHLYLKLATLHHGVCSVSPLGGAMVVAVVVVKGVVVAAEVVVG